MSEWEASREIAGSVAGLMAVLRPDSEAGRRLNEWARERETLLGLASPKRKPKSADAPLSRAAWNRLRMMLAARADAARPGRIAVNASGLADALALADAERGIFLAMTAIQEDRALEELCERIVATRALTAEGVVAACSGLAQQDVTEALMRGALGPLGLVEGQAGRPGFFDLHVPYPIVRALRVARDANGIERALLGDPAGSPLAPSDFDHVARERDFARDLLRGAVAARQRGVNILLYGPPGSGKTELAKVLAREAGLRLFAVGESDEHGGEPDRWDRMAALKLGERLLARRTDACLLFDEMEDIQQSGDVAFSGGKRIRRAGSKAHFNRFLERNAVPVLWTVNALDEFDPAFIRRMSFAFELKAPPRAARARLWIKSAAQQGLALDARDADALAGLHDTVPGIARGAVSAVALAKGDSASLGFVVGHIAKAVDGREVRPTRERGACDSSLLNADCDLAALERNVASMPRDVSFCFHGPSGTGKSLYARHLARRMGIETLEKKGSDFLSKWVGESEKQVAAMFEQAAEDGRFLIIDEAESLFWSRGGVSQSWEVSLVNAFLVALENHAWPVAITTNHLDRIDPAALRRFVFKVKLAAMTAAQSARAFERFFDAAPPARLAEVTGLTPGDFAVVRKQLAYLGDVPPEKIADLLEGEARAKNGAARRIGF
ncbi:MAG TPA: AAA family ATPase [Rhizomicrobium sp.]|jgi:SpoVK/Ycf46/Vps4 family AAA+-type ATPase